MIELYATPHRESRKVRILLEETGLPHICRAAARSADALRLEALPVGPSPSILDPNGPDGVPCALGDARAIAQYLARKARRFGPETAREHAEFDHWAGAISERLAPLQAMLEFFAETGNAEASAATGERLRALLRTFEEQIAMRHFMIAERFTLVDALLLPHLAREGAMAPLLEACPNLERYRERLMRREAVRRALAAPGA